MQNPLDEKLPAYVLVPIPLEMLENSGIDIGDMVQFASGEGIVVMEAVEGPEIFNYTMIILSSMKPLKHISMF